MKNTIFNKVWFIPLVIFLMLALIAPWSLAADNDYKILKSNGLNNIEDLISKNLRFELNFIEIDKDSKQITCITTGPWNSIDVSGHRRPGQVYFSDMTVKGPFVSDRKAVIDWINSVASGKGNRKSMTLSFQDDMKIQFLLKNVLPVMYQPPSFNIADTRIPEETLVFNPQVIRKISPKTSLCNNSDTSSTELTEGKFAVDIDGVLENVTAMSGGGVTWDKKECTPGDRPDNVRTYTITKVNWQNIVLEKNYVEGDRTWEEWFKKAQNGEVENKTITLNYYNSKGHLERGWVAYNTYPIRYDIINVDSRSGSSAIREVMELVVEHAEYK